MNRPAGWRVFLVCAAVSVAVSGCGEKLQSAGTRKSDVAPSQGVSQGAKQGAPAAYTAQGWKAGDATSWEVQIKRRAEGQDEYTRTARN